MTLLLLVAALNLNLNAGQPAGDYWPFGYAVQMPVSEACKMVRIEWSSDLVTWNHLKTVRADENGVAVFVDHANKKHSARFYRAVTLK